MIFAFLCGAFYGALACYELHRQAQMRRVERILDEVLDLVAEDEECCGCSTDVVVDHTPCSDYYSTWPCSCDCKDA